MKKASSHIHNIYDIKVTEFLKKMLKREKVDVKF